MSREFSEEFGGRLIVKTAQAGAIVVGDKGVEIRIAFGMVEKAAVVGGAVLRPAAEMVAEAAIEALDHAVGLRAKGADEAVRDRMPGADAVKGVIAGRFVVRLAFLVDGEAIGERGAIVGQDGVDGEREAVEEARQETSGGLGPAIGEDFAVDKAGGTVDRDISVTAVAVKRRQVLDIDMDKPRRGVGLEGGGRRCFRGKAGGQTVALQAPVDGAARQLLIDAAPHRFDDVVERQGKAAAQLDDQAFFPLGHRRGQPMRTGRAIDHILTVFPAGYGSAMDAELAGQHAGRGGAFLNIGADARRGGGVGVQFEVM